MHFSPATPASVLIGGIAARHSEMSARARAVSSGLSEISWPSLRAHARLEEEAGAWLLPVAIGFSDCGSSQPHKASGSKTIIRMVQLMSHLGRSGQLK